MEVPVVGPYRRVQRKGQGHIVLVTLGSLARDDPLGFYQPRSESLSGKDGQALEEILEQARQRRRRDLR